MKLRKLRIRNKKGITPIIAVILLMMMTVAAAGEAFFWVLRIQSSFQGSSEQHFDTLNSNLNSQVEPVHAQYDGYNQSGNFTLILKNAGSAAVPLTSKSTSPTTNFILKDNEQDVICSQNFFGPSANCTVGCGGELGVNSQTLLILNLTSDCAIEGSNAYPNGSVFFFEIDFSGVSATGGTFRK